MMRQYSMKTFSIPSSWNSLSNNQSIITTAKHKIAICLYREKSTEYLIPEQSCNDTLSSHLCLNKEKIHWFQIRGKCRRMHLRIYRNIMKFRTDKIITCLNRPLRALKRILLPLIMKKANHPKTRLRIQLRDSKMSRQEKAGGREFLVHSLCSRKNRVPNMELSN